MNEAEIKDILGEEINKAVISHFSIEVNGLKDELRSRKEKIDKLEIENYKFREQINYLKHISNIVDEIKSFDYLQSLIEIKTQLEREISCMLEKGMKLNYLKEITEIVKLINEVK